MPKITKADGATYAGHRDVSAPHDVVPHWQTVPIAELTPTRAGRPTPRPRARKADS